MTFNSTENPKLFWWASISTTILFPPIDLRCFCQYCVTSTQKDCQCMLMGRFSITVECITNSTIFHVGRFVPLESTPVFSHTKVTLALPFCYRTIDNGQTKCAKRGQIFSDSKNFVLPSLRNI